MTCTWNGRENPRVVRDRHIERCADETCPGCAPCPESHCRICLRAHSDGTCAECLATTRDTLWGIARMCSALPEEVEHRGVDSEAAMLWGPTADPEARQHVEAAYLSGRLPEGWIEASHGKDCPLLTNDACVGCAGGELHPLYVLGSWDMLWRDALEHDEPEGRVDIATAVDYLDRQLTYMAGFEHVPFEDFARDLRRCHTHLESVLHDGEQRDTGAPCMTCNVPLERVWGDERTADGWKCPRCRQTSTEDQYRFAVAHLHREEATELTDHDMEIRTGVRAGTIRVWARRGLVRSRRDSGRVVYLVEDVERRLRGESA